MKDPTVKPPTTLKNHIDCPVCKKQIPIYEAPSNGLWDPSNSDYPERSEVVTCPECKNPFELETKKIVEFIGRNKIRHVDLNLAKQRYVQNKQGSAEKRKSHLILACELWGELWERVGTDTRDRILDKHLRRFGDRVAEKSEPSELAMLSQNGIDSLPLVLSSGDFTSLLHDCLSRAGEEFLHETWPFGLLAAVDSYCWLLHELFRLSEQCLSKVPQRLVNFSDNTSMLQFAEAAKKGWGSRNAFEQASNDIRWEVFEDLIRQEIDIPEPKTPSPVYRPSVQPDERLLTGELLFRKNRFNDKVRSLQGKEPPLSPRTPEERFESAYVKCWAQGKKIGTVKKELKKFRNWGIEQLEAAQGKRRVPAIPLFMEHKPKLGRGYRRDEGLFQYFWQIPQHESS